MFMENPMDPREGYPRLYFQDSVENQENGIESISECMINYAGEHFDLSMSLKNPQHPSFTHFLEALKKECVRKGLKFLLIHDETVSEVTEKIRIGKLNLGFHLDFFALWHEANDPFALLSTTIQDSGGTPINAPSRSKLFTDKANSHYELNSINLGVPRSLILRPGLIEKSISQMVIGFLGKKQLPNEGGFFLKKANGFGNRGVTHLKTVQPELLIPQIQKTLLADPLDSYLLQEEVRYSFLQTQSGMTRPAYWRVINCMGNLHPFWWKPAEYCSPDEKSYIPLEPSELRKYRLQPLLDYAEELRELSKLEWFSTEICLNEKTGSSRHQIRCEDGILRPLIAIDTFNDQCDVHIQSRWHGGPPDVSVYGFARRFADYAFTLSRTYKRSKAS